MAVLKLQAPVSELRGTVGGVTYSINGSGRYCKAWRQPVFKRSDPQSVVRNHFGDATLAWRTLTQEQRDGWISLAADPPETDYNRFGEVIYLSGLQWFTRCNLRLLMAGQDTVEDAPGGDRPAAVTSAVLGVTVGGNKLVTYDGYPELTGMRFVAFGQWVRSPSVKAYFESYVYLKAQTWSPGTQVAFTNEWDAAFPLTIPGSVCFCRVFVQDENGLRSLPAEAKSTAA